MIENRTLDDLTEEEIEEMEQKDPERLAQINENTNEVSLRMMFPNGMDDDDY